MEYFEHTSYKTSFQLSSVIWKVVKDWDSFNKNTLGNQLVRAVDSVSANIAEGWHRYYKKDKLLFYNYSRSSFYEAIDHINKSIDRGLIPNKEAELIKELIKAFPKEINGLIKSVKDNLTK
jgi:four helix bundle protein